MSLGDLPDWTNTEEVAPLDTSSALSGRGRAKLHIFVVSLVHNRALAKWFEQAMPGTDVVAFGRFTDFTTETKSQRPNAALAPIDALIAGRLAPAVYGVGESGRLEPYSLLTHKPSVSLDNLSSQRIGVVDVVGRTSLPDFVRGALDLKERPKVQRVLKAADLVPLLTVGLADAVFVPDRLVRTLVSASKLDIRVLRPPRARLGRTALAFPSGARDSTMVASLSRLSEGALSALGVTHWELAQ